MKIVEYKMVMVEKAQISDEVTKLIGEGWQPFGTPAVLPPKDDTLRVRVYQAMVKTGKDRRPA